MENFEMNVDSLDHLSSVYSQQALAKADHLAQPNPETGDIQYFKSPLLGDNISKTVFGGSGLFPSETFMNDDCFSTFNNEYMTYKDIANSIKF